MMNKLFVAFILLSCFSLRAQRSSVDKIFTKNDYINRIDSLTKEFLFDLAIEEYRNLKKINKLNVYQSLELASLFSQTKQTDSAFYYLEDIINKDSNFSDISTVIKSDLYFVNSDNRWDNWLTIVINNYDKNISKLLHYEYCKSLINLRIRDNSFYKLVYFTERKYGRNSPMSVAVWELKENINNINSIKLDSLVEKYGWPTFSMVGKEFASMAFFIIQHSKLEIQKKYLSIILDAYNNNEVYFNWVAMLTDKILVKEKKPQIYGSQGVWHPILNKYVLYEVEDPKMCNQLREKYNIGEPISEKAFNNMYKPN